MAPRDAVVADKDARPHRAHDLVAIDEAARVLNKMAQKRERFGPKGAFHAVRQQHAASQVQHKAVECVCHGCFRTHSSTLRWKFQENFIRISAGRHDTTPAMRFARGIDTAAKPIWK
jgi:hypothetical protein